VTQLDCRTCGACCINPPSNRDNDFHWWVELAPSDPLTARADLVIRDPDGVPHLRLAADGRCVALEGTPNRDVTCSIYSDRPSPCRQVQPGDDLCLLYRSDHGLT
jgi:Fe-S-cluster containining protein